jgi:hypothetical protein
MEGVGMMIVVVFHVDGVKLRLNYGNQRGCCSSSGWYKCMEFQQNDIGRQKLTRRKKCPSTTLPTTNPTWFYPGASLYLRGDRPVTNCLSRGTAWEVADVSWWAQPTSTDTFLFLKLCGGANGALAGIPSTVIVYTALIGWQVSGGE